MMFMSAKTPNQYHCYACPQLEVEVSADSNSLTVSVPPTRSDVLHACDVVEDVAIAYGYNNIPKMIPASYTQVRAGQMCLILSPCPDCFGGRSDAVRHSAPRFSSYTWFFSVPVLHQAAEKVVGGRWVSQMLLGSVAFPEAGDQGR